MDRKVSFREILANAAPENAAALERKARLASALAKLFPTHKQTLYAIKHAAISQLFQIPGYRPAIRHAALTPCGHVLLSIKYSRTCLLQHVVFDRLDEETRRAYRNQVVIQPNPESLAAEYCGSTVSAGHSGSVCRLEEMER